MNSQPSTTAGDQQRTLLSSALAEQKPIYRRAIAFSMVTSILVLAPTVFMLEVYDRVVNSRSGTTLILLLICLIGIYILMEVIEMLRGRLLQQAGWRIDAELREKIHDAAFLTSLRHGASSMQPFNDLRTIREFIASPAVTAMMDAPSSLLFHTPARQAAAAPSVWSLSNPSPGVPISCGPIWPGSGPRSSAIGSIALAAALHPLRRRLPCSRPASGFPIRPMAAGSRPRRLFRAEPHGRSSARSTIASAAARTIRPSTSSGKTCRGR